MRELVSRQTALTGLGKSDFRSMRWLGGEWRGTNARGAGQPFFERYVIVNDSTMAHYSAPDSLFSSISDSSWTGLRQGRIVHGSSKSEYALSHVDAGSVVFIPVRGAQNMFIWRKTDADHWLAVLLTQPAPNAPAREVVYEMTRIRRR
jgi:hypothetical protein